MSVRERTTFKIVFLIVGVMFSWFTYEPVLNSTDNPYLAIISMGIILAFWIGTLKVRISRWKSNNFN